MCLTEGKEVRRVIEESVPGKQVTIAHVIASPVPEVYECLGICLLYTSVRRYLADHIQCKMRKAQ